MNIYRCFVSRVYACGVCRLAMNSCERRSSRVTWVCQTRTTLGSNALTLRSNKQPTKKSTNVTVQAVCYVCDFLSNMGWACATVLPMPRNLSPQKMNRKKLCCITCNRVPNFLLHFSQSLKFYNRCEKTHWSASVVSQKLQSDKNYEKPWKSRKNGPSWKIKKPLVNDWVLPTFCPLFLLYRRRKWHFDHVFEPFSALPPVPSKIDFFEFLKKKFGRLMVFATHLWCSWCF